MVKPFVSFELPPMATEVLPVEELGIIPLFCARVAVTVKLFLRRRH
jgi:hypothetical protein